MIARTLFVLAAGSAGLFGQALPRVLSSIIPSSVAAGTPSFTMQLMGGPFCEGSAAVLNFSGSSEPDLLPTTYISASQLTAQVSPPAHPSQYAVYVDNSACDHPPTNSLTFVVTGALAIYPDSLPPANVGQFYSFALQTLGGNPAFTWSAYSLPSGMSLNASTGVLSGSPPQVGDFSVLVSVVDRFGASASKSYTLSVQPPLISLAVSNLPNGAVGVRYDQSIHGAGGTPPYQYFFLQGTLPPGLTMKSDGSGEILGTPTTAGTYNFAVTIRDSALQSAAQNVTVTIDAAKPEIVTEVLPSGTVGVAYAQTLTTSGSSPYHWSIVSINTTSFTINSSTGVFSGTPQTAGEFSVTIQVTDGTGASTTKQYSLTIHPAPAITTPSVPGGSTGEPYSVTIEATGTAPFTWSVTGGSLPDGLTLDPSTGKITGTPTGTGTFDVTITAAAADGLKASKVFHFDIGPPVSITTTSLPDGTVGKPYSGMLTAAGGGAPYAFSVVARTLPDGLVLDSKTGAISGTPTAAGTVSIGFGVTDAATGKASRDISIRILAPLSIPLDALPTSTVGAVYTQTIPATGGLAPYVFSGTVPDGFTLDPSTGVITGTPTALGPLTFTVTVTDALKATTSKNYTIQANLPPLPPTSIGGLPPTSPPARQPNVTVSLDTPFPVDVTGTLTLTFTSAVGGTDNTVQFTTGGRTINFTIPKNTKTAVFPGASPGVITGTVAGTIQVTASFKAGSTDLTPSPAPVQNITVDQGPPVLTKVVLNTTSTGYEVLVTGYSTTRSMIRGSFTFAATSTANLQTTQVTVPVDAAFLTWFSGTSSSATGGMFTVTVPFSVSGPSNAVSSVSVVLTNVRGDSNALSPQ